MRLTAPGPWSYTPQGAVKAVRAAPASPARPDRGRGGRPSGDQDADPVRADGPPHPRSRTGLDPLRRPPSRQRRPVPQPCPPGQHRNPVILGPPGVLEQPGHRHPEHRSRRRGGVHPPCAGERVPHRRGVRTVIPAHHPQPALPHTDHRAQRGYRYPPRPQPHQPVRQRHPVMRTKRSSGQLDEAGAVAVAELPRPGRRGTPLTAGRRPGCEGPRPRRPPPGARR